MNCTYCGHHACRSLGDCGARRFDKAVILREYKEPENQAVVQAAARLVDGGRSGSLNRLQEIIEYAKDRSFVHLGIAYCYSMEKEVTVIADLIRRHGIRVSSVSCTTGGLAQDQMNEDSSIHKVGCNPLGQAEQLNLACISHKI